MEKDKLHQGQEGALWENTLAEGGSKLATHRKMTSEAELKSVNF